MPNINFDSSGFSKLSDDFSITSPSQLSQSTSQYVSFNSSLKGQNPGVSFSSASICAQFSLLILSCNTSEHGFKKIAQAQNYCRVFFPPLRDTRQSISSYHYKANIYRRQACCLLAIHNHIKSSVVKLGLKLLQTDSNQAFLFHAEK